MDSLTGRLLVAVPRDGVHGDPEDVFDRSVVLLLNHSDDGAHGLVLNRPLAASIDAVLPGWQQHVTAPDHLFQGGPVSLDSAMGLVSMPGHDEPLGLKRLFRAVGLVDLDAPPEVVMPEVAALRIFAGYAGWSPGQLEQEMAAGMWWAVDAEAGDAFTDDPAELWSTVLRRQPSQLAFAATYLADPRLN